MAFDGYDIVPEDARAVVNQARGLFDGLDGMEHSLKSANGAVADAAGEADIKAALDECHSQFLHPFIVTMIETAENIFTSTDSAINAYENGDTEMADSARTQAVEDIRSAVESYDNMPEYAAADTTGDADQAPSATAYEATGGQDW